MPRIDLGQVKSVSSSQYRKKQFSSFPGFHSRHCLPDFNKALLQFPCSNQALARLTLAKLRFVWLMLALVRISLASVLARLYRK